jgi:hypothetical protein
MANKFTTICLLMYGDYPELHSAAIGGLMRSDLRNAQVRIWCNIICEQTFDALLRARPAGWQIYVNSENRPKYKLMRDIFHDERYPITTPWVTWLDDDTLLQKPDWAVRTQEHLEKEPSIDFCGLETNSRYYPGASEVVKSAEWYTGKKFGKRVSRHVYGAYWWLRVGVMRALDWPDKRLSHNGGDWLLSEALRQQQYKQVSYSYGIKVQLRAKRRGLSEVSVGRRNKKHTSKPDGKAASMINKMGVYEQALKRADTDYGSFDSKTLIVTFPDPATDRAEQLRLAKLAEATYPKALPQSLFIEQSKAQRVREERKRIRQAKRDARRGQPRTQRKSKAPAKTTNELRLPKTPRVVKEQKKTAAPAPKPAKPRKTLKKLLEERQRR